jgi:hypothetical protein
MNNALFTPLRDGGWIPQEAFVYLWHKKIKVMLSKENIVKLSFSWSSKSQHDWELSNNLSSDNPVITWDEYSEANDRHASFEIAFEKLGVKFI